MLSNPWVVRLKPDHKAQMRLFCFPSAGGGIAPFHSWLEVFPSSVELCAVQLPGRENRLRESPYTCLVSLVETLAEKLQSFCDIPFAFFGHSMGALISFELARHFRRMARPTPFHLFVSGRRAPQLPERYAPLAALPDSEFWLALQRRYDGVPDFILQDAELRQMFLPILRADLTVIETYRYADEPPLDSAISGYAGTQDVSVNFDELDAWRKQTRHRFDWEIFPGGHFYWQQDRARLPRVLAKKLSAQVTYE